MNGGLGNQIFQHVLLFWIEDNLAKKIIIFISDYTRYKNYYRRLREVQPLFFYNWLIDNQEVRENLNLLNRIKARVNIHLKEFYKDIITNKTFIRNNIEDQETFLKEISQCYFLKSSCIYNQILNYQCFKPYWRKIGILCIENLKVDNDLRNENYFDIVLHLRKGDYISKTGKNLFANVSKNYYLNSIKYIVKKRKIKHIPKVLVIGNDLDWAKSFLKEKDIECTYRFKSEIEDFFSISNGKNLIVANSSFSYAAAMVAMSNKEDTLVVCPSKYYVEEISLNSLKNKNWINIDN